MCADLSSEHYNSDTTVRKSNYGVKARKRPHVGFTRLDWWCNVVNNRDGLGDFRFDMCDWITLIYVWN